MATEQYYLALDLGAESGRAILGALERGKLEISEEHRFPTGPEYVPTMYPGDAPEKIGSDISLIWDFIRFWHEIKDGVCKAATKGNLKAIGVDTWGVDFALLDRSGGLISLPYHYRDNRSNGMTDEAFKRLGRKQIFDITGIQFLPLNTIFQLLSMVVYESPLLQIVDKFLMVPDLINYWLTGRAVAEFTEATTTQMLDAKTGKWSDQILSAMGFPKHIFPEIVPPGTVIGPIRESLEKELDLKAVVVAPASHDTGAAVSAVPAESEDYIWISSGTWSIVGMNTPEPVINEKSYSYNLTNEGGLNGTYRFSKNVMGLWIVQQCKNQWKKEGKEYSYTELTSLAEKSPSLKSFADPDFEEFLWPGNMVEKVKKYCQITDQPVPQSEGEVVRTVLEGLALKYRYVIEKLEEVSGKMTSVVHIVGGGTKNRLLNQFTADALGRKVIAGPIEATSTGNLIVQAIAMGDIKNWEEGVSVIRASFDIETFHPGDQDPWNKAYEEFINNFNKINQAF